MRVTAWVIRFIINCIPGKRNIVPLSAIEVEGAINHWVKKVQADAQAADGFEEQKEKLNLKNDENGILRCYGRIKGDYPIYLPALHPFTGKLILHEHIQTFHGGVNSTVSGQLPPGQLPPGQLPPDKYPWTITPLGQIPPGHLPPLRNFCLCFGNFCLCFGNSVIWGGVIVRGV